MRERDKERRREKVCVCVCMWERERERERERECDIIPKILICFDVEQIFLLTKFKIFKNKKMRKINLFINKQNHISKHVDKIIL
jgi:hypothetical protein